MSLHADPEFEAKYNFCRVDCDECKRLDAEELATGMTGEEVLAEGIARAMQAIREEEE